MKNYSDKGLRKSINYFCFIFEIYETEQRVARQSSAFVLTMDVILYAFINQNCKYVQLNN